MFRNKSKKCDKEKRSLSNTEFLKGYEAIWKEGPSIKYQTPDAWNRHPSQIGSS